MIVDASLLRLSSILGRLICGYCDNLRIAQAWRLSQLLGKLPSIHIGQSDVQQNDLRLELRRGLQGLKSCATQVKLVTGGFHPLAKQFSRCRMIFNNQDTKDVHGSRYLSRPGLLSQYHVVIALQEFPNGRQPRALLDTKPEELFVWIRCIDCFADLAAALLQTFSNCFGLSLNQFF